MCDRLRVGEVTDRVPAGLTYRGRLHREGGAAFEVYRCGCGQHWGAYYDYAAPGWAWFPCTPTLTWRQWWNGWRLDLDGRQIHPWSSR